MIGTNNSSSVLKKSPLFQYTEAAFKDTYTEPTHAEMTLVARYSGKYFLKWEIQIENFWTKYKNYLVENSCPSANQKKSINFHC